MFARRRSSLLFVKLPCINIAFLTCCLLVISNVSSMSLDRLGRQYQQKNDKQLEFSEFMLPEAESEMFQNDMELVPAVDGNSDMYLLVPAAAAASQEQNLQSLNELSESQNSDNVESNSDMLMLESEDTPAMEILDLPENELETKNIENLVANNELNHDSQSSSENTEQIVNDSEHVSDSMMDTIAEAVQEIKNEIETELIDNEEGPVETENAQREEENMSSNELPMEHKDTEAENTDTSEQEQISEMENKSETMENSEQEMIGVVMEGSNEAPAVTQEDEEPEKLDEIFKPMQIDLQTDASEMQPAVIEMTQESQEQTAEQNEKIDASKINENSPTIELAQVMEEENEKQHAVETLGDENDQVNGESEVVEEEKAADEIDNIEQLQSDTKSEELETEKFTEDKKTEAEMPADDENLGLAKVQIQGTDEMQNSIEEEMKSTDDVQAVKATQTVKENSEIKETQAIEENNSDVGTQVNEETNPSKPENLTVEETNAEDTQADKTQVSEIQEAESHDVEDRAEANQPEEIQTVDSTQEAAEKTDITNDKLQPTSVETQMVNEEQTSVETQYDAEPLQSEYLEEAQPAKESQVDEEFHTVEQTQPAEEVKNIEELVNAVAVSEKQPNENDQSDKTQEIERDQLSSESHIEEIHQAQEEMKPAEESQVSEESQSPLDEVKPHAEEVQQTAEEELNEEEAQYVEETQQAVAVQDVNKVQQIDDKISNFKQTQTIEDAQPIKEEEEQSMGDSQSVEETQFSQETQDIENVQPVEEIQHLEEDVQLAEESQIIEEVQADEAAQSIEEAQLVNKEPHVVEETSSKEEAQHLVETERVEEIEPIEESQSVDDGNTIDNIQMSDEPLADVEAAQPFEDVQTEQEAESVEKDQTVEEVQPVEDIQTVEELQPVQETQFVEESQFIDDSQTPDNTHMSIENLVDVQTSAEKEANPTEEIQQDENGIQTEGENFKHDESMQTIAEEIKPPVEESLSVDEIEPIKTTLESEIEKTKTVEKPQPEIQQLETEEAVAEQEETEPTEDKPVEVLADELIAEESDKQKEDSAVQTEMLNTLQNTESVENNHNEKVKEPEAEIKKALEDNVSDNILNDETNDREAIKETTSMLTTIVQVPFKEQQVEHERVQEQLSSTTLQPLNVLNSVLNYVNASFMDQMSNDNSNNDIKQEVKDEQVFSSTLRRYDGAQVWRIVVQNDKEKRLAEELQTKYDGQLWKEVKQEVDYLLKPQVLADAELHVKAANLTRIVLIDNLQKVIEVENPSPEEIAQLQNRNGQRLTWEAYHRLEDIHEYFSYLAKTYPDICSVETIGYSIQKRPLIILKISNGNANNPGIWIDGGMHAREWVSPAVVTYITNQIVEGWDDLPEYMRNINWYIHAVANPDGYEYSHTTDRLWRKNMRSHGRACPGVDLNRNFGYKWGGKGTSANPCSQTYRGSKAFSEPETFYISKFISNFPKETFKAYISVHSYGQYILYPWGYDYHITKDMADLDLVARQAGTIITKSMGDKYTVGSSAITLYPAAGGSDDWAKGIAGIKYAYTIEMGDTGRYGFILPAEYIIPNGKNGLTFVQTVAKAITMGKNGRRRKLKAHKKTH